MTFRFLTRGEVERLHTLVLQFGGGGADGLRDAGLLESAIARPMNSHSYGEDDLFILAATYAEGIARNHAFQDGNKRTAFQSADMFLFLNGVQLRSSKDDADKMVALATGELDRDALATHFRTNASES